MKSITVKSLEEVPPYQGPNTIDKIRFRPLREALGVSAWGMNVLELDPECQGYPEHDHANDGQEEVYVVLRGSVVLQAGGSEWELETGDFVRVAAEQRRKFVTRAEGVTLLALGGTPNQPYSSGLGQKA